MTRIRFEDLPSTNTPINAENLNKLNNVDVGINQPTDNEEVWIKYIKNYFTHRNNTNGKWLNKNDGQLIDGNATDVVGDFIKVEPNKEFIFGGMISDQWFIICGYNSEKQFVTLIQNTRDSYGQPHYYTIPSNVEYIRMAVNNIILNSGIWIIENTGNIPSDKDILSPSINVNNNGNYETMMYANIYSTSEVVIGEFMGKPLYRKVINITEGLNHSDVSIDHNISNLSEIVNISATQLSYNSWKPVPTMYLSDGRYNVSIYAITDTSVEILIGEFMKNRISKMCVILEYTKTTD